MNVAIPGQNLKVFVKSIQTLMKTGDDIYFDLYNDRLSVRTLNMSKTASIKFDFSACFFTCFNLNDSNVNVSNNRSSLKSNRCYSKLKLPSKSFQSLFKSTTYPIDRDIEICRIYFAPNEKDRLMFCFKYCTGVTKTHWIRILEIDDNNIKLKASQVQENIIKTKNSSTILSEVLSNLQAHEDELNIDVADPNGKNIVFRNFNENDNPIVKSVRSQVTLVGASEFETYIIRKKTVLSILIKPFKLAVQFADIFHLPVTIRFNGPEKPLIVLIDTPVYNVEFMLAAVLTDDNLSDNSDEISQQLENVNNLQEPNTSSLNVLNKTNYLIDESFIVNNITDILTKEQENNINTALEQQPLQENELKEVSDKEIDVNIINNESDQQQPLPLPLENESDIEIDVNVNNNESDQQQPSENESDIKIDVNVNNNDLEQQQQQQQPENESDMEIDVNINNNELEKQTVDIVPESEKNSNFPEQNNDTIINSEVELEKFIFSRCFDTLDSNESHSSINEKIFVDGTQ